MSLASAASSLGKPETRDAREPSGDPSSDSDDRGRQSVASLEKAALPRLYGIQCREPGDPPAIPNFAIEPP